MLGSPNQSLTLLARGIWGWGSYPPRAWRCLSGHSVDEPQKGKRSEAVRLRVHRHPDCRHESAKPQLSALDSKLFILFVKIY
jgi:hypothetical protein